MGGGPTIAVRTIGVVGGDDLGPKWRNPIEARDQAQAEGRDPREAFSTQLTENAAWLTRNSPGIDYADSILNFWRGSTFSTIVRHTYENHGRVGDRKALVSDLSDGRSLSRSEGEVIVRRVRALLEEPPLVPLNSDDLKCVCMVEAKVGGISLGVLCDTGAGKSLIRTDVAHYLQEHCSPAESVSLPQPLSKPLNCEGAEKGRIIGQIQWYMMIKFDFEEVALVEQSGSSAHSPALRDLREQSSGSKVSFVVKCYVMDNLSDPIILGIPELLELGAYLEPPDETGRKWIQFTTKRLRLPLLDPKKRRTPMQTETRRLVVGPELYQVAVTLGRSDFEVAVE